MSPINSLLLILTLAAAPGPLQQPDPPAEGQFWLPPEIAEGLARQLAGRMKEAGLGPVEDSQRLVAGARRMVAALRNEVDTLGEDGIFKLAPKFSGFELPQTGQRELDLLGRYNVCNLVLLRQFEDPAFRDDVNAQVTSTLGLTAVSMVLLFLHEPFVAAGNDVGQIEAHLTNPRLQPIFDRIQEDVELRASVEGSCQPVVTALLEKPLTNLGERQR